MANRGHLHAMLCLAILLEFIAAAFLGAAIVFSYQNNQPLQAGIFAVALVVAHFCFMNSIFKIIDLIKKEEE